MMKIFLIFLLTINCTFSVEAQTKKQTPDYAKKLAGIEKELEKVLKDQKAVGFSVAIVHKDKVLMSKGFGYRDLENKKPVTPNTLFAIGSSSKAFTSSILGQLEKEGKLKLNDVATNHLPELKFKYDYMNSGITIRDMMCHRTGLSRFDYSWYMFNTSNRDSLIQRVQHMEPNAKLREEWQYNNWMFLAQGMIAEKITNKTWEQNIQERFFTPLKMTRSNTDILKTENDSDASFPYGNDNKLNPIKLPYYNINGMGPAGSINSSANDMANWVSTWIMGGKFQGQEILPASYVKAASSSQMVIGAGLSSKYPDIQFANYGLAWFLKSYRGHYLVEHGGNIDGFSASVAFYPSDSIGIVVLVNQNGSEVTKIVRNIISDRLFDLSPISWNEDAKKEWDEIEKRIQEKSKSIDSIQIKGTSPSHPLKDYTGLFSNDIYSEFSVYLENDTLKTKIANETYWFKHYHYNVFNLKTYDQSQNDESDDQLLINFATSNQGKIESVSIELDEPEKATVFTRQSPKVTLSKNELDKYIGDYDLNGQTIKIYLKETILMVLVPGQPDYETKSIGNDTFELTIAKGYSVKFTIENGNSTAITFIQPNGNFVAKRK